MDNIFLTNLNSTFPHFQYFHNIFIIIIHWKRNTFFNILSSKLKQHIFHRNQPDPSKNITIINYLHYLPRFFTIVSSTQSHFMPHTHLKTKVVSLNGQILLSLYTRTFLPFWITHISNTHPLDKKWKMTAKT